MRVACGWDHRGGRFVARIEKALRALGHDCILMGAETTESVDYPDFAFRVAEAVSRGEAERGVLVCGTGIGMAIAANKVRGIRAAVVHDVESARISRAHNDANVLCMGESTAARADLEEILATWLATAFEGGRHARRLGKITDYERRCRPGADAAREGRV